MNIHKQTRAPYDENSPAKSLKENKKEFYLRMKKNKRNLWFKSLNSYHLRHRCVLLHKFVNETSDGQKEVFNRNTLKTSILHCALELLWARSFRRQQVGGMPRARNNVSTNFDKPHSSLRGEKWNVIVMNEKFCLHRLIDWFSPSHDHNSEITWVSPDCGGVWRESRKRLA